MELAPAPQPALTSLSLDRVTLNTAAIHGCSNDDFACLDLFFIFSDNPNPDELEVILLPLQFWIIHVPFQQDATHTAKQTARQSRFELHLLQGTQVSSRRPCDPEMKSKSKYFSFTD